MLWPKSNLSREDILVNSARDRARSKKVPFDLTAQDIIIPEVCPYLKTPFKKGTRYAASLDRIIPNLGYVNGNIEVLSLKANCMKSDASAAELLEFAYEILDRN